MELESWGAGGLERCELVSWRLGSRDLGDRGAGELGAGKLVRAGELGG